MTMEELHDISNIDDIRKLVDVFYDRVREDALLAPIFNGVIQDRWPQHLETMYRFWETVLLGNHTYYGSPFVPHARLPIDAEHFDAWLAMFTATVDELFAGKIAEEAKWRANKMAVMFETKIKHFQKNNFRDLL